MNISPLRQRIDAVQAEWLVVGIFEDDDQPPVVSRGTVLEGIIARLAGEKEVAGSLGELTVLHDVSGLPTRRVLLVGLGPRGHFGPGTAFSAGFAAGKKLAGRHRASVAVALPPSDQQSDVASALLEGASWPRAALGSGNPRPIATRSTRSAWSSIPSRPIKAGWRSSPWSCARDCGPGGQPGARPGEHATRR